MRGEWIVIDEERGQEGRRLPSRASYERALLRSRPMLQRREYRISEFSAPKTRELFTISVAL